MKIISEQNYDNNSCLDHFIKKAIKKLNLMRTAVTLERIKMTARRLNHETTGKKVIIMKAT